MKNLVINKLKESFKSTFPLTFIVFIICLIWKTEYSLGLVFSFLLGSFFLTIGMAIFDIGANLSMLPIGTKIVNSLTKKNNVTFLLFMSFLIATIITIAEPDLLVLANQTPNISPWILIFSVGIGVGISFLLACIRILRKWNYNLLLILFCLLMIGISLFSPKEFLGVAFDSGGVTTGALSVPFIMSLSRGLSAFRTDKAKKEDAFGLIALCSIGPIIMVLLLGIIYHPITSYDDISFIANPTFVEVIKTYIHSIPMYAKQILISISPIIVLFFIFNSVTLKLKKKNLMKIIKGLIYTFIGLTIFLTGVNIGFVPMAYTTGRLIAENTIILVLLSLILGFFIIYSEPALKVLLDQIEEITNGTINKQILLFSLSIGVSIATSLAVLRIIMNINLLHIMIPSYLIAIALSFYTPKIFTRIAFDSGGVASGTMTASFLLPFAMGISEILQKDILTSAFGLVAIIATIPLITVEIIGIIYKIKTNKQVKEQLYLAQIIDY